MPKQTVLTNLVVNAQANALAVLVDGGFIDIYDGKQPETSDAPITTQTLGVTLSFGSPAFEQARSGVITSNPIKAGVAVNSITARWARITRADHKTPVLDVSVGTTNTNIILPTTTIAQGVSVTCSSFMHTVAKSAAGS